ncbi:MAG TPA: hypothetical protein VFE47_27130 [Tepidisphaeraceae bacterium]|jgi:plasmid stability protein|nr:hypothetical protein [Tepidisphaeraceae bacterium]
MEDEARDILRNSLNREKPTPVNIAATIRARVKAFGGINLPPTAREPMRQPIDFARRL